MHINHRHIIFVILISVSVISCKKPKDPAAAEISWSGANPLTIPEKVRYLRYEKGNLLFNHSFEQGKYYNIDSLNVTTKIDGWNKIGNNVFWVDIRMDSIYNKDEVFSGKHAIKIVRPVANETDKIGDGVESDFIRVIPGNYLFSFYIKLFNISGNRERLGTKLYDAVNIRFLYFDKNKIQIEGKYFYPQKNIYIDNSFKSYSFSNFWSIDSSDWIKVIGKSHNFPFPDGDIADEAKYIKIFAGLKGTGTMWIDSLDLRYTKNNLTALERIKPKIDSTINIHDVLVPSPKKTKKLESIKYFNGRDKLELPLILIPSNASEQLISSANLIIDEIETVYNIITGEKIKLSRNIVTYVPNSAINSNRLIFSIGETYLFNKYKNKLNVEKLKEHQQSYIINSYDEIPNVVFLYSESEMGNYFSAGTAIQLFDHKNFIFHNACIFDYPDLPDRSFVVSSDIYNNVDLYYSNILKEISKYKFTGIYIPFDYRNDNYNQSVSDFYKLKDITSLSKVFKNYILLQQDSSCYVGNNQSDLSSEEYLIDKQNKCYSFVLSNFKEISYAGITYMSKDYYLPENYSGMCNITTGHLSIETDNDIYILNKLKNISEDKNAIVEFIPAWYNNELINYGQGKGEAYFRRLNNYSKSKINIFWSGESYYSWKIDEAEYLRFKNLINDNPVLWDNSLLIRSKRCNYSGYIPYYPLRIRLSNLMEPYWNEYSDEMISDLTKIVFNYSPVDEFDIIRLATASEFAWNNKNYDPDLTLFKILTVRYGITVTKQLLLFNDNYLKLYQTILKLKSEGVNHKFIKEGIILIDELKINYVSIEHVLGNDHQLVHDLDNTLKQIIFDFNEKTTLFGKK